MIAWYKTEYGFKNRQTNYSVEEYPAGGFIVKTPSNKIVYDAGQIAVISTEGAAKSFADMLAWR